MGPILGHTMHYRRMIITLQLVILFHFYFKIKKFKLKVKLKGILKEVFFLFLQ